MSISSVAIGAAQNMALNTTKLVDATVNGALELGTNTTRETLKTVDTAQSAANALAQSTLNITKSASTATAELTDTVTKNSAKMAKSGLSNTTDIADSTLTAASSISKMGMNQVSQVTNVALEKSGQISAATINATGNAMLGLLNSVNNVVSKKSLESSAYGQGITSRSIEIQKRGMVQAIEKMFSDNLRDLKTTLGQYVKAQNEMIKQLLVLFKSTKCKKGLWGFNCDKPQLELGNYFEAELKKVTGFSNQNILRLNSVQSEAKGTLFKLYSIEGDLFQSFNREGNALLLPFYTKSTEIYQETLVSFETLYTLINKKIKEELKGGKRKTRRIKRKWMKT